MVCLKTMSSIYQFQGLSPSFRSIEDQSRPQSITHQVSLTIGKYQVLRKGKLGLKALQFIKKRTEVETSICILFEVLLFQ